MVQHSLCRDKLIQWHLRSKPIWNGNFCLLLVTLNKSVRHHAVLCGSLWVHLFFPQIVLPYALILSQRSFQSCDIEPLKLTCCCRKGRCGMTLWVSWQLWYQSNVYRLCSLTVISKAVNRSLNLMQTSRRLWRGTAYRLFRKLGNSTVSPTLMGCAQLTDWVSLVKAAQWWQCM